MYQVNFFSCKTPPALSAPKLTEHAGLRASQDGSAGPGRLGCLLRAGVEGSGPGKPGDLQVLPWWMVLVLCSVCSDEKCG